jgi:hypothetical protein
VRVDGGGWSFAIFRTDPRASFWHDLFRLSVASNATTDRTGFTAGAEVHYDAEAMRANTGRHAVQSG